MIAIISGLPGAGKSLKLARIAIDLLFRNEKYFKKSGVKRMVYTNLKLSQKVLDRFEGFVKEWIDPADLTALRNADVLWDEVATHLDATQWANMSLELKRWLQQHRKFGVELYGTTQDFAQIDKSFRRLTSDLIHLTKLFGSRDKSATRPEVKRIWGLSLVRSLDPQKYNEEKSKFEAGGQLPGFLWISREDVEFFDTTAEVAVGKYPPLRHLERECENLACSFHKTIHV